MIQLTDLRGGKVSFSPSFIREMKSVPDTVLVLLNGNCLMVRESMDEILSMLLKNPRTLDVRATGMSA
ncbi:MAG: hypothetical protein A2X49_05090 [Lentisphaerae bacterium GWF2_52_8]|nr:MAG: hypothetical protein A2X49_05090 [Lentisphaerae bacterium GWF2_52_8]